MSSIKNEAATRPCFWARTSTRVMAVMLPTVVVTAIALVMPMQG